MAATVVPNRWASLKNVSPAWMVYWNPLGQAGVGPGPGAGPVGMQITCPICRLFGLTPGLAA